MSMSMRLTAPFLDDDTLARPFFQKMSVGTDKLLAVRSRAVPQLDRRQVGVGLLRNINPVQFDISNSLHRQAWATFHTTGKWVMHFILEQPWDSVPQMIHDKLLAQLADQIGSIHVEPAPIRLVHDSVVANVPSEPPLRLNPNNPEVAHVPMRSASGEVYYTVVEPQCG